MRSALLGPNDLYATQRSTHVNLSARVSANECFLLSELLASDEGAYFHRVEWRKIERVYCSEHCSPFHSHSCVNMTDVQSQTVCVCVYIYVVKKGERQHEGERISQKVTKRDVSVSAKPDSTTQSQIQLFIFGISLSRLSCAKRLPGHAASLLADRCVFV